MNFDVIACLLNVYPVKAYDENKKFMLIDMCDLMSSIIDFARDSLS